MRTLLLVSLLASVACAAVTSTVTSHDIDSGAPDASPVASHTMHDIDMGEPEASPLAPHMAMHNRWIVNIDELDHLQ